MTIIRVEYDGVRYDLDVLEETPIRVDISAIENSSIGEVFGAASQGFTLPGSKKNNRFFKHAYKVGVESVPGLGESVPCWVISKSDTLIEGSLFLDEVVKTPNGGYNYEVTIVNNVVTFNESVKTVAVKDLDWDSYDHQFSVANVTGSWTDNLFGGDIYYPLIDMGTDGSETTGSLPNVAITPDTSSFTQGFINNSSTPLQVRQLTPAIRVSTVLDKIFEQGEFSYSSSLQPLFDSLYILPKQTEDLSVKGSGFTSFGFIASSSADQTGIIDSDGYVTASIDTEIFDESGTYNPTTYTYTVGRSGTHQFRGVINYEIDPEDTSPLLTGRIRNITTNTTLGSNAFSVFDITGSFTVETDLVNLSLGDEVQLQMDYTQGGGVSLLEATIASGSNFSTLQSPLNYETGTIKIGEQFEPQTKCIDILQGLIQKLNLVIEPVYTENRTLKIETFSTWADSGKVVDWTRKIQQADRISLRSPLSSQQKTLKFEDNKDNDKLSKEVIDNAEGFQWGTEVVDAASDVPQGEKKLGTYFAPVILERIEGGTSTNLIPQLYKTDNSQIGKKTFKFKPRLGYKINNTLSEVAYIGNDSEQFQDYATISNYNTIPVVSGSTENLHYNESFYPPTFDTSQTGSITSYEAYWNGYIDSLYITSSKILSAEIQFEPNELADIALNDKIFVEDNYYRINKIKGFNVNNNDVVGLELISLRDGFVTPFVPNCVFEFNAIPLETNKYVEINLFNNTSTNFTSSANYTDMQFTGDQALRLAQLPIGTDFTSSTYEVSGSKNIGNAVNLQNFNYGTIEITSSLELDNILTSQEFITQSFPSAGPVLNHGSFNTNLYTSYSLDVYLNPYVPPTTTTTTTSTTTTSTTTSTTTTTTSPTTTTTTTTTAGISKTFLLEISSSISDTILTGSFAFDDTSAAGYVWDRVAFGTNLTTGNYLISGSYNVTDWYNRGFGLNNTTSSVQDAFTQAFPPSGGPYYDLYWEMYQNDETQVLTYGGSGLATGSQTNTNAPNIFFNANTLQFGANPLKSPELVNTLRLRVEVLPTGSL